MRSLNTYRLLAVRNIPEIIAGEVPWAALLKQKLLLEIASSVFTTECTAPSLARGAQWAVRRCVREDWMEV